MAFIYRFTDGNEDRMLLGNKGANLVTMSKLGLRVPPGFVVSIEAFRDYERTGTLPEKEILEAIKWLEKATGRQFGKDMMVSVRSTGPVSMPGMMDTVLNVKDVSHLMESVRKVFASWHSPRATEYRRLHNIPSNLGTAAIIQAMVMGNRDELSGTGVVFSRNPSTGERGLFGEYLHQAQGEDLVSGARTPVPVARMKEVLPKSYAELEKVAEQLERHYREMQDIEFTVESGTFYILQTRSGKRGGHAAVKIAVDMAEEGLISKEEALLRITPDDLRALLHRRVEKPEAYTVLAKGLNAAPGAAVGAVVFSPDEAVKWSQENRRPILVRPETSPDDIHGIAASVGVLTSRGGLTSHAAIVTRALGKPCICGAEEVKIDLQAECFTVNGKTVRKGETITIDGTSGNVYLGSMPLSEATIPPEVDKLLSWADSVRRLGVRANADTAEMAAAAKRFAAQGIGLCRTERQFNSPDRLAKMRQFLLAETEEERHRAIAELRQLQKQDFADIFKVLEGLPIIIRLLDPPLHEFLPHDLAATDPRVKRRIEELQEVNPMMGHRGVRVAITHPELYRMQMETIAEAKGEVESARIPVNVSIMIPQVITVQEILWVRRMARQTGIKVGIMVETVRACLRADQLAREAAFFSFGTNDLTQAVYSFSREDAEKGFLSAYLNQGILQDNPFEILDVNGVGRLMELAVKWARQQKKDLEIGICGEHGGEPRSIRFCHHIGLDYVSCSPFRVPVARLVAAQAALEERMVEAKAS